MRKREVSRTERLLNRMNRVIEDLKLDENALKETKEKFMRKEFGRTVYTDTRSAIYTNLCTNISRLDIVRVRFEHEGLEVSDEAKEMIDKYLGG